MILEKTIAVEGKKTSDGRLLLPGSLEWRDLPLPVVWVNENRELFDSPAVVGRLIAVERREGGLIEGKIELFTWESRTVSAAISVDSAELDVIDDEVVISRARLRMLALHSTENAVWEETVFEVPDE